MAIWPKCGQNMSGTIISGYGQNRLRLIFLCIFRHFLYKRKSANLCTKKVIKRNAYKIQFYCQIHLRQTHCIFQEISPSPNTEVISKQIVTMQLWNCSESVYISFKAISQVFAPFPVMSLDLMLTIPNGMKLILYIFISYIFILQQQSFEICL